jgi:hypothetical protein
METDRAFDKFEKCRHCRIQHEDDVVAMMMSLSARSRKLNGKHPIYPGISALIGLIDVDAC